MQASSKSSRISQHKQLTSSSSRGIKRQSLTQMLKEMGYPSIRAMCMECNLDIGPSETTVTCKECLRRAHVMCSGRMQEVKGGDMLCESCQMRSNCLYCEGRLSDSDDSLAYCTVCECRIHGYCFSCPNFLLSKQSHPYFGARPVHTRPLTRVVCRACINKWKIKEVVNRTSILENEYYYVSINHPSLLHYTWLKGSEIQQYFKHCSLGSQEKSIEIEQPMEIETVLSIYVPPSKSFYSYSDIFSQLMSDKVNHNWGAGYNFKVLIKWKNLQLINWNDLDVLPHSFLLLRFMHETLLSMSRITINEERSQTDQFSSCIREYLKYAEIFKVRPEVVDLSELSDISSSKATQNIRDGNVQQIFNSYQQIHKASSHKDRFKEEVVCRIINTLSLTECDSRPTVLFTHTNKVAVWVRLLQNNCPLLSVMSVTGSFQFIKKVSESYLYHKKNRITMLRSRIIVLTYENLAILAQVCPDISNMLATCGLLVYDGLMHGLAKYYHQTLKVSKLCLLCNDPNDVSLSTERQTISARMMVSLPFIPQQSKEVSHNQDYNKAHSINVMPKNRKKSKDRSKNSCSPIKSIPTKTFSSTYQMDWERMRKQFSRNKSQFIEGLPDETYRVCFLRFLLSFGLKIKKDSHSFKWGLAQIDSELFCQEMFAAYADQVLAYFANLLTVITVVAKGGSTSADQQLASYFIFDFEPKHLIQRTIFLDRLTEACSHFVKTQSLPFSLSHPVLCLKGRNCLIHNWSDINDYCLSRVALAKGYGNWLAISEYMNQWEQDMNLQTLRRYISRKIGLEEDMQVEAFVEFVQRRLECVMDKLMSQS